MAQRPRRLLWPAFVLALGMALAAGCGPSEATPTPTAAPAADAGSTADQAAEAAFPLVGTAWTLDFFGPPEQPYPLLPDTRATITYFWDRYVGYDGCNWFLGAYSTSAEGELRNSMPSATPNVCEPEELYSQAGFFVTSLLNVTAFEREGDKLIQNTVDDQRLLTLSPAPVVPMPGTVWELKFWWAPVSDQWSSIVPGSMTTISFDSVGQASGSGGCSDYTVTYEGDLQVEKVLEATDTYAELPTLTFGPITSQPLTCEEPEGIMDQEQGFLAGLGTVAYYFKVGGMLLLLDSEGAPLAMLGART